MEMINRSIEDNLLAQAMVSKLEQQSRQFVDVQESNGHGHETRTQRRARERAEKKAEKRATKTT